MIDLFTFDSDAYSISFKMFTSAPYGLKYYCIKDTYLDEFFTSAYKIASMVKSVARNEFKKRIAVLVAYLQCVKTTNTLPFFTSTLQILEVGGNSFSSNIHVFSEMIIVQICFNLPAAYFPLHCMNARFN